MVEVRNDAYSTAFIRKKGSFLSFRSFLSSRSFLGIGSLVFSETHHGVGPCGVNGMN